MMKKRVVKAIVPLLVILAFLFSAVPVMAEEEEDGTGVFTFEDTEYHVYYVGSEIVDSELNVSIGGFGSTLQIRNGKIMIVAWASAVVDGVEIDSYQVSTSSDGIYTYLLETDQLPEKVLLYPVEQDEPIVLWEGEPGTAPAGSAGGSEEQEEETGDAADAALPAEMIGAWHGTGTPKNGGPSIDLSAIIEADGTGEYVFIQDDYTESYPFTISNEDNRFAVDIPEDNYLGISACGGTWEYTDGVLKLDITTQFAGGGSYSYTAECEKEEAEEQPAEEAVEEPEEEAPAAEDNEPYDIVLRTLQDGEILEKGFAGEAAGALQELLGVFGEDVPADGIIGQATMKALHLLQEEAGLDMNDVLDAEGFEQLMDSLRN